ncbi:MAG: GGDEF domain-containing protein [Armatimonadetes bacterium]|nr:GGDEF domain-containing protein [Armatimonadota bacterium]
MDSNSGRSNDAWQLKKLGWTVAGASCLLATILTFSQFGSQKLIKELTRQEHVRQLLTDERLVSLDIVRSCQIIGSEWEGKPGQRTNNPTADIREEQVHLKSLIARQGQIVESLRRESLTSGESVSSEPLKAYAKSSADLAAFAGGSFGLSTETDNSIYKLAILSKHLNTGATNLENARLALITETERSIAILKAGLTIAYGSIISLMLLSSLLIFGPLFRRARAAVDHIADQNGALEGLNEQLTKQAVDLSAQHHELVEMHDKLELHTVELQETAASLQRALDHAQQASEIARFSASRFQELFQGIPVPAFTFDPSGTIFEWNHAAGTLYGKQGYEVFQQSIYYAVFREEEHSEIRSITERVFRGETIQNYEREDSLGGEKRFLLCAFFPLRNPLEEVVGGVCAALDITERKLTEVQLLNYQEQIQTQMGFITEQNILLQVKQEELENANCLLQKLATTDGLTGLTNHRTFQEKLESEYRKHQKTGAPLSLILFDVDKFKTFNDEYGHQAGDDVLIGVARLIEEVSLKREFTARYGGEEFAIILPNCTADAAMIAAERFRAAFESKTWPNRPVTASFGVSTLTSSMTSRAELISCSDQALYVAKNRGRNCAAHYDECAANQKDVA